MEENKIIFLGTAGDSVVYGRQMRASGGIILRIGEVQLHLDPGPGALVRAVENQINLRANTAVLVSNNKLINCNDVNAVIDAMTYGGLDKQGVLVAAKSVVEGTENSKQFLTDLHKSFLEKIMVMNPNQKVGIEDIEIHAVPISGDDPTGIGFKILAPNFTLGYTSDTKYTKEVAEGFKGCDIIILNVPEPADTKVENNLNSADAAKFIGVINPKLAILTHFGYKMVKVDPLIEVRNIQKETKTSVIMAKDGFAINPISYSANSQQRRLTSFEDRENKDNNQIS